MHDKQPHALMILNDLSKQSVVMLPHFVCINMQQCIDCRQGTPAEVGSLAGHLACLCQDALKVLPDCLVQVWLQRTIHPLYAILLKCLLDLTQTGIKHACN